MKKSLLHDDVAVKYAAEHCESISQMLEELGVARQGRHYLFLRSWSGRTGIPLPVSSHRRPTSYRTNEDVFVEHSTYSSGASIKKRLINDFGWPEICMMDGCPSPEPEWNGVSLSLQLDHINGVHNDNRLENLRFLCPNCHSQTETFGSRNWDTRAVQHRCSCGNTKSRQAILCMRCRSSADGTQPPKIDWPLPEDIIELLRTEENYLSLGKKLGVSDNAIRKYLTRKGITPPKVRDLRRSKTA